MVKISVCLEDEEANQESRTYFSKIIQPRLTQAGYEIQSTLCPQAWSHLASYQPNIILFLVSNRQSSCWQIAQRIHNAWDFIAQPLKLLMIIKWGLDDSPQDPAYFNKPEYTQLYDDYYEGFAGIPWWVNFFWTREHSKGAVSNDEAFAKDGNIIMSDLSDAFRFSNEKRAHLSQLLNHYHELVPRMYIIDPEGNVRVGQFGHHSYLLQGQNVYGAGEMFFTREGEIVRIDDQAGNYYGPVYQGRTFGQQFRDYLKHLLTQRYHIEVDDSVFRGTM